MKFNKSFLICMVLLAILSLGVVSADENATLDQNVEGDVLALSLDDVEVAGPIETNNLSQLVEDEDYWIHVSDLSYDSISTVKVAGMPWDASGNISISIDGKQQYNQGVSSAGNALILNDLNLAFDNHKVLINYSGDGKYAGFVKNATINPYFSVSCSDEIYEWGTLDVHTTSNLPGYIKIVIDNKVVYNKKTPSGYVEIELDEYSLGTHSYEVFYSGKSFKKGKFNRVSFQVSDDFYEDDPVYGDSVKFWIETPDNSKGFAKFKGKEYPFEFEKDEDGCVYGVYVVVSGFDVGENIVEFHAMNKVINRSVSVKPKIVMPTTLWINGSNYLTFNASSDLNGDLILSGLVNGTYKVKDGFVSVPISNLSLGEYQLNVKYENYTWDYNVTVLEETPELIFYHYYPDVVYTWDWIYNWEDTYDYRMSLYGGRYNLMGTVRICDDKGRNESYEGGFYELLWTPYWFDAGKHNITVSFDGDSNFKAFNRTIEYEVADHSVLIDNDGVFVRVTGEVVGTLTVYLNGNLSKSIKFNGVDDFYDSADVPFTNLKKGENYVVDVVFKANNDKYSFNYTQNFTLNCPIHMGDVDIEWGGYFDTYDFILPEDIKNKPVVKIDGKAYEYTLEQEEDGYYDHWYSVNIRDLKPGIHNIVVSYEGDDKYPSNSSNATIKVTASIVGPDGENFNFKEKFDVYLDLPKDATGNLSVEIKYDGQSDYSLFDTTPIVNGHAAIDLPSNRVGKYMVNAYFKGNYEIENYTSEIEIVPTVSALVIKYGDQGKITVSMDNMSNAKLVLCLDEDYGQNTPIAEFDLSKGNVISINKEIIDRAKSMMIIEQKNAIEEGHAPYMYLYASIYKNDAKFNDVRAIKVSFASKITGLSKNINMKYSAGKTLTLYVYDIFGKRVKSGEIVKITIGKKTFSVKTNKNGVAKFKIPNTITPGKYTIRATYKDVKVSKKLTVTQILTVKTVKVKKSAKKLVLTATLKKVNGKYIKGKRVTFKFNGKTYKAETSKKGVAKVTIKKSVLKKLKVGKKIKYQATYLKVTVKKTVKVKR